MKTMGVDPAYGSSSFAICITELIDVEINVLFADEYPKADFNQMIILTLNLIKKFRMNFNSGDRIYIDGQTPHS